MNSINTMLETSLASLALADLREGVAVSQNFRDLADLIGQEEATAMISQGMGLDLQSPRGGHYSIILVCASDLDKEDLATRAFRGLKAYVGGSALQGAQNTFTAVMILSAFSGRDPEELRQSVVKMIEKIRDKVEQQMSEVKE